MFKELGFVVLLISVLLVFSNVTADASSAFLGVKIQRKTKH
jgi:hypothetical protein